MSDLVRRLRAAMRQTEGLDGSYESLSLLRARLDCPAGCCEGAEPGEARGTPLPRTSKRLDQIHFTRKSRSGLSPP